MNLVVLVSFDWICINNVIYDLRQIVFESQLCRFCIVWLMHPVSVITHMLNILDTFNMGVTVLFIKEK